MLSAWSNHLVKDPEAKKNFEDYVRGSKNLTDRLQAILTDLESGIERSDISIEAFNNPNWAYMQAYKNGCKAMLQRVKTITDTTTKEEK